MTRLFSYILVAAFTLADATSCTKRHDDGSCAIGEDDSSSLLQGKTNIESMVQLQLGAETLFEMTKRQHEEMEAKKMEFFTKALRAANASVKAQAAHGRFRTEFLSMFHRHYDSVDESKVSEYTSRLETFAQFLELIDARNANEAANNTHPNRAVHGITKYSDWTASEFSALLGSLSGGSKKGGAPGDAPVSGGPGDGDAPSLNQETVKHRVSSAPCSKEWTSRTSMRNQGNCGSCWTFAAATTLRASYIQQHGVDPGKLSTQYLVDCVNIRTCSDGVNGCCGGDPRAAFEYIMNHGGIPTQEDYGDFYSSNSKSLLEIDSIANRTEGGPISNTHGVTYSGNHPTTPFPCKKGIKKTVTLTSAPEQLRSESDMADYVCNTGVLGIVVDASQWNSYKSGVLSASTCSTSTDHAVTVVGMSQQQNAWIVQNQWGANWGVSLTGAPPPMSKWSNCPQLAQNPGCHDSYNAWIATDCALECSGDVADGGYVYMKFGENTCGITEQVLAPKATAAAGSGGVQTPLSKCGATSAHWCYGYKPDGNWCWLTTDGKTSYFKDGEHGQKCASFNGKSATEFCANAKR